MPDLTLEIMQMCESLDVGCVKHVGGYTQSFTPRMDPTCTCPAFKFSKWNNKTCKHIREAEKTMCHWHEQYSDETQTKAQEENCICPSCGGHTVYVRVAV